MAGYKRRSVLFGGAVIVSTAGCVGQLGNSSDNEAAEDEPERCPQPSTASAGDGNRFAEVGVDSLEWEETTLVIQFDPSFEEWDGWVIHHEYEDPGSYRVVGGEYPRVDEPQEISPR